MNCLIMPGTCTDFIITQNETMQNKGNIANDPSTISRDEEKAKPHEQQHNETSRVKKQF